jgi:hypothetical protein
MLRHLVWNSKAVSRHISPPLFSSPTHLFCCCKAIFYLMQRLHPFFSVQSNLAQTPVQHYTTVIFLNVSGIKMSKSVNHWLKIIPSIMQELTIWQHYCRC